MWADHPARQLDDECESEAAKTPVGAPEEAQEVDPEPDMGRSADGKSSRLCGRYLCLLGERQVPPAVRQALMQRRISRKRGKYRQWMAKRQLQADALMLQSEMDVPTVEALMACPLSKYIHFRGMS